MLIVDGHNLTFGHDDARRKLLGGDPEGSRRDVLACVHAYAEATKERALVVFDGTGGGTPPGGSDRVRYCFSGERRDADEEIVRRVRAHTGRRETCVVTSDRSLAAAVRKLGAKTVGLKAFLREVRRLANRRRRPVALEPAAKYKGPSPAEVEYWLTVFRDEDVAPPEKGRARGAGKGKL